MGLSSRFNQNHFDLCPCQYGTLKGRTYNVAHTVGTKNKGKTNLTPTEVRLDPKSNFAAKMHAFPPCRSPEGLSSGGGGWVAKGSKQGLRLRKNKSFVFDPLQNPDLPVFFIGLASRFQQQQYIPLYSQHTRVSLAHKRNRHTYSSTKSGRKDAEYPNNTQHNLPPPLVRKKLETRLVRILQFAVATIYKDSIQNSKSQCHDKTAEHKAAAATNNVPTLRKDNGRRRRNRPPAPLVGADLG